MLGVLRLDMTLATQLAGKLTVLLSEEPAKLKIEQFNLVLLLVDSML